MRAALFLVLTFAAAHDVLGCIGRSVDQATAAAVTRRGANNYSPRGTFSECFLVHFGPEDKASYESVTSPAIREAFLYQYMIVAFDAAASVPQNPARAAEYYLYAIGAAETYLELSATTPGGFSAAKLRDVLYRLGVAYYNRRNFDPNAMQDLVYQYESIAEQPALGIRSFDRRAVDEWERALRCLSGNCQAETQLEAKIRAERADLTDFVQRCTSFAQFLTRACEDLRLAVLQSRKNKFDRFLQEQT